MKLPITIYNDVKRGIVSPALGYIANSVSESGIISSGKVVLLAFDKSEQMFRLAVCDIVNAHPELEGAEFNVMTDEPKVLPHKFKSIKVITKDVVNKALADIGVSAMNKYLIQTLK